jgi:hypothetical protein
MRYRVLRLLLAAGALAVALGCSSDEPGGGQPPWPDMGGGQIDSFFWPDWAGIKQDFWFPDYGSLHEDSGSQGDGAPGDGAPPQQDGSGSCPGPQKATCNPPCQAKQMCTEANGGRCAKVYTLTGPASGKGVLLQVALAYVDCWNKQPSVDTLCSTFDTCGMSGQLTESMVKTWLCNTAQVSDFPSSTVYDQAKGLVACSWYQTYRPDWKLPGKTLEAQKKGIACLSYDHQSYWLDDMDVDYCNNFPPK